ncbi:hypothetical protein OA383_02375 [Candidatus Pelagibacter bacterium]|nr:hypothetical protein [Candidatus Pelagibacter bacterium]|tara:strand:+ start:20 stop:517 length:498 start_codon:yes stop_codon:yes gene_type:complete
MIFNFKKHNNLLYNTLLKLSRNLYFYKEIELKDTFETRIYLMFLHFSIILIIYKFKKIKFPQASYDSLFQSIENNLRELGQGDVAVNKKMKDLNKVFYDILLKINSEKNKFEVNKSLILKYFDVLNDSNHKKCDLFIEYYTNFYNFCFELPPESMIKDAIKFEVK